MTKILNVAPNTTILSAWGNSVTDELNNRTLKVDGLKSQDGTPMQMTGDLLLRNADPTNASHAARKKYVDDKDALNLKLTGGTLTGKVTVNEADESLCLILRSQATGTGGAFVNSPYLAFYNAPQSTRFGYLQATAGGLNLVADSGAVNIISGTSGDIVLNSGGAQVRATDAIYATGGGRFYSSSSPQVTCVGAKPYVALYNGSSVDSIGTNIGYFGFGADNHMHVQNTSGSTSNIYETNGYHIFKMGGSESLRFASGVATFGKTDAALATVGLSLFESGTIYATRPTGSSPPIVVNRLNSVDAEYMVQVCRNGTTIGRIEQEGTTGSKFVSGSDRRMKTIQGPITDAITRIKAMKPYRVTWKSDPGRGTTDAFIADEMASIVPEAVSGEPNAVSGPPQSELDPPEGTPIMQGMSYEKLITVTIAALQEVIARVEDLEAA